MAQHFSYLSFTSQAVNTGHLPQQRIRIGCPFRCLEFAKTPVESELNFKPAQCRSFVEHLGLKMAGMIPGRLAAGGRI